MKRSSYMIGIAVIMMAAAFALVPLAGEDADADTVAEAEFNAVYKVGNETFPAKVEGKNCNLADDLVKAATTALDKIRGNYVLAGWTDEATGITYAISANIVLKADTVFVPYLTPATGQFEVTFEIGEDKFTVATKDKKATLPAEAIEALDALKLEEDIAFDGWYIGDVKQVPAKNLFTVTEDCVISAEFRAVVNVKWIVEDIVITTQSTKDMSDVTQPADPVKANYKFTGWAVNGKIASVVEAGKVVVKLNDYVFTDDTEFVAVFEPSLMTVTFVVGEFTTIQTVLYGQCAMAPALPEGYVAWLDAEGKVFDFKSPIVADVTITAQAYVAPEVPVYKMTFVVDTTTVAETSTADVKIPADPAKTGFEFMGWAVDGTVVDMETYEVVADTVFTAQFKELIFTVQFLNKDGSTFQAAQTVKYGQTVTMPASSFIGWQTKVVTVIDAVLDEDGNVVTEASEVISYSDYNFATPVTGDLDLYGEEAVVEPGFFETPTGKCVIIIAVFIIGFMLYKAYPTVIAPKLKAKGGKKE